MRIASHRTQSHRNQNNGQSKRKQLKEKELIKWKKKKKKGELSVFSMVGSNTLQIDSLQKITLNKCHGTLKPAKKAGQI